MEKQITKAQALEMALEIVLMLETQEQPKGLADKLQAMLDTQVKSDGRKSTKPSKTAVEKEKDIEEIEAFFCDMDNEAQKLFLHGKEITEALGDRFTDYTPQKITSRLSVMVAQGILVKDKATSDKKKTGYKLA